MPNKSIKNLQERYYLMEEGIKGNAFQDPRAQDFETIVVAVYDYLIKRGEDESYFFTFDSFWRKLQEHAAHADIEYTSGLNIVDYYYLSTFIKRFMAAALKKEKNIDIFKLTSGFLVTSSSGYAWSSIIDVLANYPINFFKPFYERYRALRRAITKGSEEAGVNLDV